MARPRFFNKDCINPFLRDRMAAALLGNRDKAGVAARECEDRIVDQTVMHNHISCRDQPCRLDRQQVRIARACAHQIDYAFFS